jgi:hypothetical protein
LVSQRAWHYAQKNPIFYCQWCSQGCSASPVTDSGPQELDILTYDSQLRNLGLCSPSVTLCLAKVVPSLVLLQVPQHQLALVLIKGGIQQCVIVVPEGMKRQNLSRLWWGEGGEAGIPGDNAKSKQLGGCLGNGFLQVPTSPSTCLTQDHLLPWGVKEIGCKSQPQHLTGNKPSHISELYFPGL